MTIDTGLNATFSGSGPIKKSCSFPTSTTGTTSGVMVYFAVAVKVELKLDESGSGTELTPGGLI